MCYNESTNEREVVEMITTTYLEKVRLTKSNNTYKVYKTALERWFTNEDDTLTTDNIISKLSEWKVDNNTKVLRCAILKAFMKFYSRKNTIEDYDEILDVISGISKVNKIPEYVTTEAYDKIISLYMDKRYRLAIELMFKNGLREDEVTSLMVKDYDANQSTVIIRNPKNHSDRIAYLNSDTNAMVKDIIGDSKDGYILHTRTGHRILNSMFRRDIKALCIKAGYPKLHAHSFRHGSAKYLLDHDVDIATIQSHLGHKSIATTQRYLHIGMKQKELVRGLFDAVG